MHRSLPKILPAICTCIKMGSHEATGLACHDRTSSDIQHHAWGEKIGYIEGDHAFDLFARPCATYDCDTGLLRNPNTQAIVGYVTLQGSFVGSSWLAQELFPKAQTAPSREPSVDHRDGETSAGTSSPAGLSKEGGAECVDVSGRRFPSSPCFAAVAQAEILSTATGSVSSREVGVEGYPWNDDTLYSRQSFCILRRCSSALFQSLGATSGGGATGGPLSLWPHPCPRARSDA